MALRNIFVVGTLRQRYKLFDIGMYQNYASVFKNLEDNKMKLIRGYKTEKEFNFVNDPDSFGTLAGKLKTQNRDILDDDGDIKEQEFLQNHPLTVQKLTIKQYADIIKQYIKHKRLKEAINVLEVRMLKEDKVKPENYIYNILIGACAEVGYTKMAFKLYNDMKKRALNPTGDTYTCLFEACINSPWPADGLKNAKHLRELMMEKGIEPNLTNYNVMIKAFGRCGDLPTAFKIVDEMISKKIKIRVHTFNHLLHACIADKENGLRHALIVWRKMLSMKEKPNIYTFNLILKCVKECNLGSKEDIQSLLIAIQDQMLLYSNKVKRLEIESQNRNDSCMWKDSIKLDDKTNSVDNQNLNKVINIPKIHEEGDQNCTSHINNTSKELTVLDSHENNLITLLPKDYKTLPQSETRKVPNLLSKVLQLNQVLSIQEVHTLNDKFAIVGGQDDFLKEMEANSVKPDVKTFTQMLPLIEDTREAENKIIETMKSLKVKLDIDFLNMLIKKRCIRKDYDGAFLVKELIDKESKKYHKSFKRKNTVKPNILTYGVLALACNTKESAEKLLDEMNEKQLKVNIEILGTLLRHGTANMKFGYVNYILDMVKHENLKPNEIFIKHLESFHDICLKVVQQNESGNKIFSAACNNFLKRYKTWLNDVQIAEMEKEHPWKQFMESQPETLQRQNIEIREPKKFYKRNRKFIRYTAKV